MICEDYLGVLGDCSLNIYGDREKADYRIYEWNVIEGKAEYVNIGYYNSTDGSFRFNER